MEDRLTAMADQGERTVLTHDAAAGEQIGRAIRALDPSNARATTVLTAAERLKRDSASQAGLQVAQAPQAPVPPSVPAPARSIARPADWTGNGNPRQQVPTVDERPR